MILGLHQNEVAVAASVSQVARVRRQGISVTRHNNAQETWAAEPVARQLDKLLRRHLVAQPTLVNDYPIVAPHFQAVRITL